MCCYSHVYRTFVAREISNALASAELVLCMLSVVTAVFLLPALGACTCRLASSKATCSRDSLQQLACSRLIAFGCIASCQSVARGNPAEINIKVG